MSATTTIGTASERLLIQQPTLASDTQGGRAVTWTTLDTVWGELVPQSANERLQGEAIGSQHSIRFRVRLRADVTPAMRVSWTPRWPPSATARSLQIHAVLPVSDGATWMYLECGELT